ncbi:helix-turn-helix domain-containing protein [Flavobacterium sp. FlaQc-48]|uniref:helix-turn-helix domain-containing protein n=1 Tax=Flavobacterium sp. FlaQc-48 TaxID=3374181 RepID=UPI0037575F0E
MNGFLMCFSAGGCFLLGFLLLFHPLGQNLTANRWLAVFVSIMGTAFLGIYFKNTAFSSLQFMLPPCIYLSTIYFVQPIRVFKNKDGLHFLPFLICVLLQLIWKVKGMDFMIVPLFAIGNFIFFIRDLLPLQFLAYIIVSYRALTVHRRNLKQITAAVKEIGLDWLGYFLLILSVISLFWLNDALFGVLFLLKVMPVIYTGSIFFLAYFSIRQDAVFAFNKTELKEIAVLLDQTLPDTPPKVPRLNDQEFAVSLAKLSQLMEEDQIFLNNDLSLADLADRLALSIHDTSYLINTHTKGNFYNFINQLRVEQAKNMLLDGRMEELSMIGIAFGSGFNSKTAFNTAFKKYTGYSPTAYMKAHKKN